MSTDNPRLRGNPKALRRQWHVGSIPDDVIHGIGEGLAHRLAVGNKDITGDDFGDIFSRAVGGIHKQTPLGIADVIWNGCAWSLKTAQRKKPHAAVGQSVRLISGRNSPDFSFGIENPREDPEKTGAAVLSIWNARVDEAAQEHDDLRIVVLLRDMESRSFLLFEKQAKHFIKNEFYWKFNRNGNLQGYKKTSDGHCFTWQPSGGQFTVIREVPGSSRLFSINRDVPIVPADFVLDKIGFEKSWISIVE